PRSQRVPLDEYRRQYLGSLRNKKIQSGCQEHKSRLQKSASRFFERNTNTSTLLGLSKTGWRKLDQHTPDIVRGANKLSRLGFCSTFRRARKCGGQIVV